MSSACNPPGLLPPAHEVCTRPLVQRPVAAPEKRVTATAPGEKTAWTRNQRSLDSSVHLDDRNPASPYIDLLYQKQRNSGNRMHTCMYKVLINSPWWSDVASVHQKTRPLEVGSCQTTSSLRAANLKRNSKRPIHVYIFILIMYIYIYRNINKAER